MNLTTEEVIVLAQECGAHHGTARNALSGELVYYIEPKQVLAFAQAIADMQRENDAQICDSVNNYDNPMTARDCADAIRANKNSPETDLDHAQRII